MQQSNNYLPRAVCREQDRHHLDASTLQQCRECSQHDTYMCLWAWMIAFTSSELTMLSILLQNTPDAVGSTMMSISTEIAANKTFIQTFIFVINILDRIFDTTRKLNHKIHGLSQWDSVTLIDLYVYGWSEPGRTVSLLYVRHCQPNRPS